MNTWRRVNLVPSTFPFRKREGREKALASAGHVMILNIHCSTNVCIPVVKPAFILVPRALVSFGQRLKRGALVTLLSGCHKIYDIR